MSVGPFFAREPSDGDIARLAHEPSESDIARLAGDEPPPGLIFPSSQSQSDFGAGASADAAPSSGLFAFVVAFVDALRASASDEPPAGGIFPSSFSQNDLSAIAADDGVGMREGGIWRVPSGNLLTAE